MAFFACGTRDKPYIRPLRPGTFLYRYSFWAGLASTTSSKVNKPASNFRRSLAERKSWRAELCSAFGMGAPRERAGVYKVYREFRTQRRPLNVAFVLRRTVEQETLYPAPPSGDRAVPATASCSDRRRHRTARFHLGRIYGERPPRSWLRYRYRQTRAAPLRESPDVQAS